jgi:Flp pilus assembly pilin Flp
MLPPGGSLVMAKGGNTRAVPGHASRFAVRRFPQTSVPARRVVPAAFFKAKPRRYVLRGLLHDRIVHGAAAIALAGKRSLEATPEWSSLMVRWQRGWRRLLGDGRGVTALEYGLIAAAIMALIVTTVISLGSSVEVTLYQNVAANL